MDAQSQVHQAEFRLSQARSRESQAVARRVRAETELREAQDRAAKWPK